MKCPNCKSKDILKKKFGFGDTSLYEFKCNNCNLYEDKNTSDADFDEWIDSWYSGRRSKKQSSKAKSVNPNPEKKISKALSEIQYDFYAEHTELQNIVYWKPGGSNKLIWQFLSMLEPVTNKHQILKVQQTTSGIKLVDVKFDDNRQYVEEIIIHHSYFPSDQDFYDWQELFRFQKLKKLNFNFDCQWISVPSIPAGTWSELEHINIYLYSRDGYNNLLGSEVETLKELLPHVKITEEIDGSFYY